MGLVSFKPFRVHGLKSVSAAFSVTLYSPLFTPSERFKNIFIGFEYWPCVKDEKHSVRFFGVRLKEEDIEFPKSSALWKLTPPVTGIQPISCNLQNLSKKIFAKLLGVLMNYCFCKTVTLYVKIRNTFCRRTFVGKSISTKS